MKVLLFLLMQNVKRKDLAARGKAGAYIRSLNLPAEFSFSTLNTGISGIGCYLIMYGSASHKSASVCFPCMPTFLTKTLSPGSSTAYFTFSS